MLMSSSAHVSLCYLTQSQRNQTNIKTNNAFSSPPTSLRGLPNFRDIYGCSPDEAQFPSHKGGGLWTLDALFLLTVIRMSILREWYLYDIRTS